MARYDQLKHQLPRRIQLKNSCLNLAHHARLSVYSAKSMLTPADNPAEIENAISVKLLPMLFADLGIAKAQQLIEAVLKITRLGLSREIKSPKLIRG